MGRDPAAFRKRIRLVGCVKSKLSRPARARDLYTSLLFVGRRRWVKRTCESWFILSAKYGLAAPEQLVAPYDETLARMTREERRAWSRAVVTALRDQIHDLRA